jgi:dienelactone hydrolase
VKVSGPAAARRAGRRQRTGRSIPAVVPSESSADIPTVVGPSRRAARGWADGAAWGAALGVVVALVGHTGRWPLEVLLGTVLAALSLALVDGLVALVRLLARVVLRRPLPRVAARLDRCRTRRLSFPLTGLLLVAAPWLAPDGVFGVVHAGAAGSIVVVVTTLTGAALGRLRHVDHRGRRIGVVAVLVAAALPLLWLANPGPGRGLVDAPVPAAAPLALDDPGALGPFAVQRATYGSGIDPHRSAFGDDATWRTEPVDASGATPGFGVLQRLHIRLSTGATLDRLPVNGTVWYPDLDTPAPLVLILHGNHALSRASDRGYAYLGAHLASHGYVVASVDQNFLNGSIAGDGEGSEMPLRTRVLLEHLRLWESLATDGGAMAGRVDLRQVALVGHSRGGEAAAHAAGLLLDPSGAPDPGWSFPDPSVVGVRAVVGLMPSDLQWTPDGGARRLQDLSYLLLGTGLDGDTTTLQGMAQYHRVDHDPASPTFSAFAYLQRGNHGQANTVWGRSDAGWLNSTILDRGGLLEGHEQRRATTVLVTAFLDAALRDQHGARAVFTRPDAARAWLPDDVVVTGYEDGATERLPAPDLAEDGAVAGFEATGRLTLRARDDVRSLGTEVTRLAWQAGAAPELRLRVPDGLRDRRPGDVLTLDYGSADLSAPPGMLVEVEDADGERATLPLDHVTALRPPLPARAAKLPAFAARYRLRVDPPWPAERLLQTYELPLAAFVATGSDLDLDRVVAVTLRPSDRRPGTAHLGPVAFRARGETEIAATGDRQGDR